MGRGPFNTQGLADEARGAVHLIVDHLARIAEKLDPPDEAESFVKTGQAASDGGVTEIEIPIVQHGIPATLYGVAVEIGGATAAALHVQVWGGPALVGPPIAGIETIYAAPADGAIYSVPIPARGVLVVEAITVRVQTVDAGVQVRAAAFGEIPSE